MNGDDFLSLTPFVLVTFAALTFLLMATFANFSAKTHTLVGAFFILVTAFTLPILPKTYNPLLTHWLTFDKTTQFFNLFFLIIVLFTLFLSKRYIERFTTHYSEYFFLLFSCLFGLMLISSANDFLTLFLGLETLSITLYVMCGFMKKWNLSKEAAMKYFFIGSIGAGIFLYGIALLYGAFGSTQFALMRQPPQEAYLFLPGIAFVTVGLLFKAAIVPFHSWAPDVYEGAATPVTAFMTVGTKVGAFVALLKVFFLTLPKIPLWNEMIAFFAIITLIYASFTAIRQNDLKRFFAYSSISQAGFLLIPFVGNAPSIDAISYYLVIYALATFAAFSVLLFLDTSEKGLQLEDLKGLFHQKPVLTLFFTIALLTLAGIPPFIGFLAKLNIFKVAFEAGFYFLVIVALFTSVVSAYYYLRVLSYLFMKGEKEIVFVPSKSLKFVVITTTVALLCLSIYPNLLQKFSY